MIARMPIYVTVCTAALVGSYVFCLLLFAGGAMRWSPLRGDVARGFPGIWEGAGILLFTALLFVLPSLMRQEGAGADTITPAMVLAQAALYLPLVILYAFRTRDDGRSVYDLGRWVAFCVLSLLAVRGVSVLMETCGVMRWLVEETGCPVMQDVVTLARESLRTAPLWTVCMTVLVAPVGEEVIFRGFLYRTLKKGISPLPAMLAVGLFFGAVHMSLLQLPLLVLLGVLLCAAYEYSKSILLPICLHMMFNGLNILQLWMLNAD